MGKKKITILVGSIVLVALIICGLLISTGSKRDDVYLTNFHVSEDESKMTLDVLVTNSAGYVRNLKVKQGGDSYYITFYSTSGLNNRLGAKDKFEIDLNPACGEIYFYSGGGGYKLVLDKDENTNEWVMIK